MTDPSFRADERDQQAALTEAMDDVGQNMLPVREHWTKETALHFYPALTGEQAQELADAVNRYGPADYADRDSDDIDIDDSGVWENSVQDAGGPC